MTGQNAEQSLLGIRTREPLPLQVTSSAPVQVSRTTDNGRPPRCILLYHFRIGCLLQVCFRSAERPGFQRPPRSQSHCQRLFQRPWSCADLCPTEIIDEPSVYPQKRDGELPEAATVIVDESQGDPQQIILQLCEWHTVNAIKE